MEARLIQGLQQIHDGTKAQVGYLAENLSTSVDHVGDQTTQSWNLTVSDLNRTANMSPLHAGPSATPIEDEHILDENLQRFSQEQKALTEFRESRSELKFLHLERVFRPGVAAPAIVSQSTTSTPGTTTDPRLERVFRQPAVTAPSRPLCPNALPTLQE